MSALPQGDSGDPSNCFLSCVGDSSEFCGSDSNMQVYGSLGLSGGDGLSSSDLATVESSARYGPAFLGKA